MTDILLITPPFVQPNAPYPATAYLKGYLSGRGLTVSQKDLSVDLLSRIFSAAGLELIFEWGEASGAFGEAGAFETDLSGESGDKDSKHMGLRSVESVSFDANIARIHSLRHKYIATISPVMEYLRGQASETADLICMPEFLPQGGRFGAVGDLGELFGSLGTADCAKYLCTLYLQDLGDYIRTVIDPHFDIVRYGEKIALSLPRFGDLEREVQKERTVIDLETQLILEAYIDGCAPATVGFTIPFPGNLPSAVKCAAYIRERHPHIKIIMGGGYPTTELRQLTDTAVFKYFDHIILDDGERSLEEIIRGGTPTRTYCREGYYDDEGRLINFKDIPREASAGQCTPAPSGAEPESLTDTHAAHDGNEGAPQTDGDISHADTVTGLAGAEIPAGEDKAKHKGHLTHLDRGCPDYEGLPHDKYFSLLGSLNPMLRIWSDGRWNKMTLAHGCYWARCSFCDTSLDYIRRYDSVSASQIADWMEQVSRVTGSRGFHFTDEAAPPRVLRELSLELLRRGATYSWWTNVRFDTAFTGDLCRLMASAGCIAVSGGLEAASDRLLEKINKGITIESATVAMRNFLYSGIMVHGYLMYGLPSQTLQETVDSLEVVRQWFRAGLMESAYWHRYAMTAHSPSGADPGAFGVKHAQREVNPFANNEIAFMDNPGYDIEAAGESLRTALAHYMAGSGLERGAHKWFGGKVPSTTIDDTLITDHLIVADRSRLYDPAARLVWLGPSEPRPTDEGVTIETVTKTKTIKLKPAHMRAVCAIIRECDGLSGTMTLGRAREIFEAALPCDNPKEEAAFLSFYHSKKWDALRECGLLQI